ncbi:MAG: GTP 3',8-cyclase MoaA, partial [Kangiellaceae bacterium]|nr:GTP 3',8-cyclase MoaA [Kangiellaceae bacterium]
MLQDNFGRRFYYLRLSITDVCNFKCTYCLPDGYQKPAGRQDPMLSVDEIKQVAEAFAALGTEKIRITGGEPALRKDLPEIIAACKDTAGIESVAITTNGYKLPEYIDSWVDAGLDRLTVSIDSFDPKMFHSITGHDRLEEILQGLDRAAERGIKKIKVNTVLMKQYNHHELTTFVDWVKDKPYTLRFIELMQTGDNQTFFTNNHVSGDSIKQQLKEWGWGQVIRSHSAGPAQ